MLYAYHSIAYPCRGDSPHCAWVFQPEGRTRIGEFQLGMSRIRVGAQAFGSLGLFNWSIWPFERCPALVIRMLQRRPNRRHALLRFNLFGKDAPRGRISPG